MFFSLLYLKALKDASLELTLVSFDPLGWGTASRWSDKRQRTVETARRLKLRTAEVGWKLAEVGSFRAWLTARSCIRASVNSTDTWCTADSSWEQPLGTFSEVGDVVVHFALRSLRFARRFIFPRVNTYSAVRIRQRSDRSRFPGCF